MSSGFLSASLLRITTKESCSRSMVVKPLTLLSMLSRNQQLYMVYSHSPMNGSSADNALFFISVHLSGVLGYHFGGLNEVPIGVMECRDRDRAGVHGILDDADEDIGRKVQPESARPRPRSALMFWMSC